MLWVVVLGVAFGVVSLAVLGALTWRLWQQVRQLGRDVAAASARISAATDGFERQTPTLAVTREGRRHG